MSLFRRFATILNWLRAVVAFLFFIPFLREAQANRVAEGFMPYLNFQSSYGNVNSSVTGQNNSLGLFNYGAGLGAAWYLNSFLLEGSVGFKFESVQGMEDNKKTNLRLNSYYLNVAANYRLPSNKNWSLGPLIQTQVSNGTIRYSRYSEESIGQVYWAGLGINYDITNYFQNSHFRVGLNVLKSMFLPNQNAYFGALVVGFAFGEGRKTQIVYKEVLPEYLKKGTFVWMKTDDPNWNHEKYFKAQVALNDRFKEPKIIISKKLHHQTIPSDAPKAETNAYPTEVIKPIIDQYDDTISKTTINVLAQTERKSKIPKKSTQGRSIASLSENNSLEFKENKPIEEKPNETRAQEIIRMKKNQRFLLGIDEVEP